MTIGCSVALLMGVRMKMEQLPVGSVGLVVARVTGW